MILGVLMRLVPRAGQFAELSSPRLQLCPVAQTVQMGESQLALLLCIKTKAKLRRVKGCETQH